jgi:hypothetical protein
MRPSAIFLSPSNKCRYTALREAMTISLPTSLSIQSYHNSYASGLFNYLLVRNLFRIYIYIHRYFVYMRHLLIKCGSILDTYFLLILYYILPFSRFENYKYGDEAKLRSCSYLWQYMEVYKKGVATYNPQAVLFYWFSLNKGLCKGAGIPEVSIGTRLAGRSRNRALTLGSGRRHVTTGVRSGTGLD